MSATPATTALGRNNISFVEPGSVEESAAAAQSEVPNSITGSRRASITGHEAAPDSAAMETDAAATPAVGNDADENANLLHLDVQHVTDTANVAGMSFLDAARNRAMQLDAATEDAKLQSIRRDVKFVPINPFAGEVVPALPDAMDDAVLGITLTPDDMVQRERQDQSVILNQTTVDSVTALGFNCNSRQNGNGSVTIAHAEEDSIVFLSGRHMHVSRIFSSHGRRILLRQPKVIEVLAFTVSSSGKYAAVAERRAEAPYVSVVKLDSGTRVSSLSYRHLSSTQVVSLCFSSNNNALVTVSAAPEQKMVFWHLTDTHVAAVAEDLRASDDEPPPVFPVPGGSSSPKAAARKAVEGTGDGSLRGGVHSQHNHYVYVDQVTISPWAAFSVASSGPKGLVVWKLAGRQLLPELKLPVKHFHAPPPAARSPGGTTSLPEQYSAFFDADDDPIVASRSCASHCWFDDGCLAAVSTDGLLVAIDDNKVVDRVDLSAALPPSWLATQEDTDGDEFHLDVSGISQAASFRSTRGTGGGATPPLATPASYRGSMSTGGGHLSIGGGEFHSQNRASTLRRELPLHLRFSQMAWASRGLVVAAPMCSILLVDRTYGQPAFCVVAALSIIDRSPYTAVPTTVSMASSFMGSMLPGGASSFRPVPDLAPSSSPGLYLPRVTSLSVSPGESNLVVSLDNNDMYAATLDRINTLIDDATPKDEAEDLYHVSADVVTPTHSPGTARHQSTGRSGKRTDLFSSATAMSASMRRKSRSFSSEPSSTSIPCVVVPEAFQKLNHIGFHKAMVTSISLATQRPLLLTTSLDHTVRVYDFETAQTVVESQFEDEVNCGAIDPSGTQAVVCMRFDTRVYTVIEGRELVRTCDIPIRPIHICVYSPGGCRIAVAVNNKIFLIHGRTFEYLGVLAGHSSLIKSVHWADEATLISTDAAGVCFTWDAASLQRGPRETVQKNLMFQSAVMHRESMLIAAVGSSKMAKATTYEGEFTVACVRTGDDPQLVYCRPGMILPKAQAMRRMGCSLIALSHISDSLVVGTPTGRLLVYPFPLLRSSRPYCFKDSHLSEILHVAMTADERFLFTVGADNILYHYRLSHIRNGKSVSLPAFNYGLIGPVVLRHVSDVQDAARDVEALQREVEERKVENAAELLLLRDTKESALKTQDMRRAGMLDSVRAQIEKATREAHTTEKHITEAVHQTERTYAMAAEDIEMLYNKRATEASAREATVRNDRDDLLTSYEHRVTTLKSDHRNERIRIEQTFREREEQLQQTVGQLKSRIRDRHRTYDAMLCQTVVDYEGRLQELAAAHVEAMKRHDDQVVKASTTASYGDREAERLRRDVVDIQHDIGNRELEMKSLLGQLERKERENRLLKTELHGKQDVLNQCERSMQGLKTQLAGLENLRFVLTHQFEELRLEFLPKDGVIRSFENEIHTRERDMQNANFERQHTKEVADALEGHIESVSAEETALRVKMLDSDRQAQLLFDSVGRLLDTYKDGKSLLHSMRGLLSHETDKRSKSRTSHASAAVLSPVPTVGSAPSPDPLAPTDVTATTYHTALSQSALLAPHPSIGSHANSVDASTASLQDELQRHNDFLQATIAAMQQKQRTTIEQTTDGNRERMTKNGALIAELQALRKERKRLIKHHAFAEVQLHDACQALRRLAAPIGAGGDARTANQQALRLAVKKLQLPAVHQTSASSAASGGRSASVTPQGSRSTSPQRDRSSPSKSEADPEKQLVALLDTLEGNSAVLQHQGAHVELLRDAVHDTLLMEERRLLAELHHNTVAILQSGGGTSGAAAPMAPAASLPRDAVPSPADPSAENDRPAAPHAKGGTHRAPAFQGRKKALPELPPKVVQRTGGAQGAAARGASPSIPRGMSPAALARPMTPAGSSAA